MTFLPEFVAVFHQTVGFPLIRWIHKDSMYLIFGGMRNTKTWSTPSEESSSGLPRLTKV